MLCRPPLPPHSRAPRMINDRFAWCIHARIPGSFPSSVGTRYCGPRVSDSGMAQTGKGAGPRRRIRPTGSVEGHARPGGTGPGRRRTLFRDPREFPAGGIKRPDRGVACMGEQRAAGTTKREVAGVSGHGRKGRGRQERRGATSTSKRGVADTADRGVTSTGKRGMAGTGEGGVAGAGERERGVAGAGERERGVAARANGAERGHGSGPVAAGRP